MRIAHNAAMHMTWERGRPVGAAGTAPAPSRTLPHRGRAPGSSPQRGLGADRTHERRGALWRWDALVGPHPLPLSRARERGDQSRALGRPNAVEAALARMFCPPLNPSGGRLGGGLNAANDGHLSHPCGCAAHRRDEHTSWEGYALPNLPTGWVDGETRLPHPPAGRGCGETGFPHTPCQGLIFTLVCRAGCSTSSDLTPPQAYPGRDRACRW